MLEPPATDTISCPYCGERVEVFLEPDLAGEMVYDCEVCCHPWRLVVRPLPGGAASGSFKAR